MGGCGGVVSWGVGVHGDQGGRLVVVSGDVAEEVQ